MLQEYCRIVSPFAFKLACPMIPLPDFAVRPVAVAMAGSGLILVGLANLLAPRLGPRARAVGSVAAAAAFVAGVWVCFESATAVVTIAAILAAGLLAGLGLGSLTCRRAAARVATAACRPNPRWGLLTAAGIVLVAGGFGSFDAEEERRIDDDMTALTLAVEEHPVPVGARLPAATDRGTRIEVCLPTEVRDTRTAASIEENFLRRTPLAKSVICREPADDGTNCHGWVFTGGRYIVTGEMAERILAENRYEPVTRPRPDDLVAYWSDTKQLLHTGIVRYVTAGMPVLVEGKWGSLGVFLHPVDKSCYGENYTFFRSPRDGHLLAGLPAVPATHERFTGAE
jgi:hypothetical protein